MAVKSSPATPRQKYTVSTWLLGEARDQLLKGHAEQIGYLTGVEDGALCTLDRFFMLEPEVSSVAYVKGRFASSHGALMEMEKRGYKLHAWIHTHPGRGRAMSHASQTDYAHQRRLEKGGYKAIGIILVPDDVDPAATLVRVFSDQLQFDVEFYGKGVEQLDEGLYRLAEIH